MLLLVFHIIPLLANERGDCFLVAYEHVLLRFSRYPGQCVPDLDASRSTAIAAAHTDVLGGTCLTLTRVRVASGAPRRNRGGSAILPRRHSHLFDLGRAGNRSSTGPAHATRLSAVCSAVRGGLCPQAPGFLCMVRCKSAGFLRRACAA